MQSGTTDIVSVGPFLPMSMKLACQDLEAIRDQSLQVQRHGHVWGTSMDQMNGR